MNNCAELIEAYSQQISIRNGTRFDACVGAEIMQERDMNPLKRRHKPKKNQYSELLELFVTPVPAVREKEEPRTESKEEEMKCALCGKQFGPYDKKEWGQPLIRDWVCEQCKVVCRNREDEIKRTYPDSIRYFPYPSDVEED